MYNFFIFNYQQLINVIIMVIFWSFEQISIKYPNVAGCVMENCNKSGPIVFEL